MVERNCSRPMAVEGDLVDEGAMATLQCGKDGLGDLGLRVPLR